MTIRKISVMMTMYLLVSCFVLPIAARSTAESFQGLPLEAGTYWIYECRVREKDLRSTAVRQKSLAWKMEILETQQYGEVTVAHLNGYLDDVRRDLGARKRRD